MFPFSRRRIAVVPNSVLGRGDRFLTGEKLQQQRAVRFNDFSGALANRVKVLQRHHA